MKYHSNMSTRNFPNSKSYESSAKQAIVKPYLGYFPPENEGPRVPEGPLGTRGTGHPRQAKA